MKICRDCKFFGYQDSPYLGQDYYCKYPSNITTDIVTGARHSINNAYAMRKEDGPCGMEGKLFEPRPPSVLSREYWKR